ncbi:MAG TPA: glycosyltransferase [Elusimicrobiota bacterium]|nr:glycosyltransferase [Elusimicrobiota bacterium]
MNGFHIVAGGVLGYFLILNPVQLATAVIAIGSLRRYHRRFKWMDAMDDFVRRGDPPSITILQPAHNEERTCVGSLRSLLTLEYASYEIIVVNDGSTDGTLDALARAFALKPVGRFPMAGIPTAAVRGTYRSAVNDKVWVIDKENGGKADALNAGINYCRTALFCAIDADCLLERDALTRIARPFIEDDCTVAVGGIVRIANGCRFRGGQVVDVRLPDALLPRFQVLEYLRAFLTGRMGWDAMNALLIISGAFGLFRRETVIEAGGFSTSTVGEDMELVVRLHRHCRERRRPYRITFLPDPVAWTECPESYAALARQRDRWQRGLAQSLMRHARMLFNPRYGAVGLLAFPYFFFLEMCGPVVELGGFLVFGWALWTHRLSLALSAAFGLSAFAFGMALSILTVALEELSFHRYHRARDYFQLFLLALIENMGYRQLGLWWRLKGLWSAARGVKRWGGNPRLGFTRGAG